MKALKVRSSHKNSNSKKKQSQFSIMQLFTITKKTDISRVIKAPF